MNDILKKNLITSLHLDTLPAEEQQKAIEHIGRIIYERVMIRVLDVLSEKDKDALDALLGKTQEGDDIAEFLQSKIPNLEQLVNEEIASFKLSSLEFTKGVTGT
jgi:hypothetical protein